MASAIKPLHARELPATRPGRFPIGRLQIPGQRRLGDEVAWDPMGQDNPHCLVSGKTGMGKTQLLVMWALEALSWPWEVTILDIKGGADFRVAQHRGATLIWNESFIADELGKITAEINRRNAFLRDTPVLSESGKMDWASRLSDLPPSMREDIPFRLVILDEAASLMWFGQVVNGEEDGPAESKRKTKGNGAARKGDDALRKLRRSVQLARSAGIHMVISLQRPDAEFLPGAIKENIGDRIMLGRGGTHAHDSMMFDFDEEDEPVRKAPRGVGVALVQGCGLPALSCVRVYLLDREQLLPEWSAPKADDEPEQTIPEPGTALVPAPGVGPRDESSDEPWFRVGSEPPQSDPRYIRVPRRGTRYARVRPSRSPRPSRPGLLPPRLRAALRGPYARLRLRAGASALLRAALTDAPRTRSPLLRVQALERDGAACRACGATHRPLQVDHRVPLWASGPDTLENVWVLDSKCHKAKTRAETAVRALRRRNGGKAPWAGKRIAFRLRKIPLLRSVYGWLYVAAFFTGLSLPQYRLGALIGLAFVTVGVAILSNLLGMSPVGGGGLDRANSLDRKIESREPGSFGRIARAHWTFEKFMALLRLRLAIGCALFAAGGFAPMGWAWATEQLPL